MLIKKYPKNIPEVESPLLIREEEDGESKMDSYWKEHDQDYSHMRDGTCGRPH